MIIQQEKAQDREKLLLKFIKIMKVCKKLGPAHVLLTLRHRKTKLLFLFIAALKKVEQFQLLPGNTVRPGLGPHQEVRVAETDFRGEARAGGKPSEHRLGWWSFFSFFPLIERRLHFIRSGVGGILHLD